MMQFSGTTRPEYLAVRIARVEIPGARMTGLLPDIDTGDPVIRDDTGSPEPDPASPAHLVFAELVPHALVIQPDPGKENQDRDNNNDTKEDKDERFRTGCKQHRKHSETHDQKDEQVEVR